MIQENSLSLKVGGVSARTSILESGMPPNAPFPMLLTLLGMISCDRPVQLIKAELPIVSSPSGKEIETSPFNPLKKLSGIVLRLVKNFNSSKELTPEKSPWSSLTEAASFSESSPSRLESHCLTQMTFAAWSLNIIRIDPFPWWTVTVFSNPFSELAKVMFPVRASQLP